MQLSDTAFTQHVQGPGLRPQYHGRNKVHKQDKAAQNTHNWGPGIHLLLLISSPKCLLLQAWQVDLMGPAPPQILLREDWGSNSGDCHTQEHQNM